MTNDRWLEIWLQRGRSDGWVTVILPRTSALPVIYCYGPLWNFTGAIILLVLEVTLENSTKDALLTERCTVRYFQFISPVNTHTEIHVVVILLAWNSKNMPFLSSLFHWQLVSFQLFPPRLLFCRKRSRTIRIHSLLKFVQQLALFTANSSERAVSIARYLLNQHCSVLLIVAFLLWLSAHLHGYMWIVWGILF